MNWAPTNHAINCKAGNSLPKCRDPIYRVRRPRQASPDEFVTLRMN